MQELEDDRLVIFCGAGISMSAGLPDFRGLCRDVASGLGVTETVEQRRAIREREYDRYMGFIERDYDRNQLVTEVATVLSKDNGDVRLHASIRALSTTTRGVRLVTTNFDRLFEKAGIEAHLIDAASSVPVPKPHSWHSLVYLHGRLDPERDPDGSRLVLTGADFGAAYLSEQWASRFVTELFRHYTVLFVGYSLGDPVMRYLVDSIAAAHERGEGFKRPLALASYRGGDDAEKAERTAWEARGVTPITYWGAYKHRYLRETLARWSSLHVKGLSGKTGVALRGAGPSGFREPIMSAR